MRTRTKFRKFMKTPYAMGLVVLVCLLWCALTWGSAWFALGAFGAVAAIIRGYKLARKRRSVRGPSTSGHSSQPVAPPPVRAPRRQTPQELGSLVEQMITDGRYALLLRPQIAGDLTARQFQQAFEMLEDEMALVPTGDVGLQLADFDDFPDVEEEEEVHEAIVRVDSLYMDRYPITNEQYQAFVDAGGYEQSSIWHPEILPAVLDFVDKSGLPGPRDWNNGRYPPGKAKHPVVGISWYEACAYARWVGKRLATDAEWVKAASWPVALGTSARRQRRYPWGQAMDHGRANLWSATCGSTVAVDDFAEGVSVGGVYQLIGNVWEWTSSTFGAWEPAGRKIETASPMKSIRGGAFDTYYDAQAHCQFQSGESPLSRKHNIGFRCALGFCDVVGLAEADPHDTDEVPAIIHEEALA